MNLIFKFINKFKSNNVENDEDFVFLSKYDKTSDRYTEDLKFLKQHKIRYKETIPYEYDRCPKNLVAIYGNKKDIMKYNDDIKQ